MAAVQPRKSAVRMEAPVVIFNAYDRTGAQWIAFHTWYIIPQRENKKEKKIDLPTSLKNSLWYFPQKKTIS